MKATKTAVIAILLLALAAIGTAVAAEGWSKGEGRGGLKALGLKFYWSLLDDQQREQAKEILADHVSATAADRLTAAARLLTYRAAVVEVLTPEQRKKAMKIHAVMKRLPEEKRRAVIGKLLEKTDRAALADRIEQSVAAAPEEKVRIGIEILDQFYDLVEVTYGEKLELTADQKAKLRALYEDLKRDLEPVALRLAEKKAETARRGMAILDAEQKEKVETFKATVLEKVLAFVRG